MFSSTFRAFNYIRTPNQLFARYKHVVPELPYDYKALEPVLTASVMEVHHSKHHTAYVNNLNNVEERLIEASSKNDVSQVIALAPMLKFNAGGHFNHSIFWQNLSPNGGGEPDGPLMNAIKKDFGSFETFKTKLSTTAIGIQGSGWAWLALNPVNKQLRIAATPNQDLLQATLGTGLIPLLAIDIWEHAYYLQYQNRRPDFVKAIWDIINWKDVSKRFNDANK